MENHPIPQDVTGFQFRLIGNMTVKQFAYVAAGSVLAVIFYYAPIFILIKIIFIPLCAGTGAALAFLPIEGRPMDLMIANFFKALFSPTQYIYVKSGGTLAISTIDLSSLRKDLDQRAKQHAKEKEKRERELAAYLQSVVHKNRSVLDEKEEIFLQSIFNPQAATAHLISINSDNEDKTHQLSEEEMLRTKIAQSPEDVEHELEKEAEAIKRELENAKQEEAQLQKAHQPTETIHNEVEALEKQLNDIMAQKQQLEEELKKLKQQMELSKGQKVKEKTKIAEESQHVHSIPKDQAVKVGLPAVPDAPNLIIGIVKDPRGNVLPNILIEIKDKDGNPVRAFKTNGLGQFASATPLANGVYTVEFEDPKGIHRFDTVEIEAKGDVMLPLEVVSTDAREELRRELFG
jgi:hypothetical protein